MMASACFALAFSADVGRVRDGVTSLRLGLNRLDLPEREHNQLIAMLSSMGVCLDQLGGVLNQVAADRAVDDLADDSTDWLALAGDICHGKRGDHD